MKKIYIVPRIIIVKNDMETILAGSVRMNYTSAEEADPTEEVLGKSGIWDED